MSGWYPDGMDAVLPVADPLESKEFHGCSGADFELSVVLDLDEVFARLATGFPFGLAQMVSQLEVHYKEIGVSIRVRTVLLQPRHDRSLFVGIRLPGYSRGFFAALKVWCRLDSVPIFVKMYSHKIFKCFRPFCSGLFIGGL